MYGAQEAVKVVLTVSMVMNLLERMDSSATLSGWWVQQGQRRPWDSPSVYGISRDSPPPSL